MVDATSFVALMRRYVEEYTHAHDVALIPLLMHPSYEIRLGSTTLRRDAYAAMVEGAYHAFPDLGIVVHEIVTSGERLALHFSEYATSPKHQGRFAVWEGIGLYRRAADGRLADNGVDQDFYGRREQLAGVHPPPDRIPVTDPQVWVTTGSAARADTEDVVRTWVDAGNRRRDTAGLEADGFEIVINGSTAKEDLLAEPSVEITDLFSAGDAFGLRVTLRGAYTGSLHGAGAEVHGAPAAYTATGIGAVNDGKLAALRLVSDRYGLRARLRAGRR